MNNETLFNIVRIITVLISFAYYYYFISKVVINLFPGIIKFVPSFTFPQKSNFTKAGEDLLKQNKVADKQTLFKANKPVTSKRSIDDILRG